MESIDQQIRLQENQLEALQKLRIAESLKLKKHNVWASSKTNIAKNKYTISEINQRLDEIDEKINENYEQLSLLKIRRFMIA